ncbi:hypothetical protein NKG94_36460 [Micromonospora sp. M12]
MEQRFNALERLFDAKLANLHTKIDAQAKEVMVALSAADKAVAKSDVATEKRFESVNEFRQTLSDQTKTFIARVEFEVVRDSHAGQIAALASRMDKLDGKGPGSTPAGSIWSAGSRSSPRWWVLSWPSPSLPSRAVRGDDVRIHAASWKPGCPWCRDPAVSTNPSRSPSDALRRPSVERCRRFSCLWPTRRGAHESTMISCPLSALVRHDPRTAAVAGRAGVDRQHQHRHALHPGLAAARPGPVNARRILGYLATIAVFYLAVGLLLVWGGSRLGDALGGALDNRGSSGRSSSWALRCWRSASATTANDAPEPVVCCAGGTGPRPGTPRPAGWSGSRCWPRSPRWRPCSRTSVRWGSWPPRGRAGGRGGVARRILPGHGGAGAAPAGCPGGPPTLVEPVLARLNTWIVTKAGSALGWILGIAGFLIARDAAARLALFDLIDRIGR